MSRDREGYDTNNNVFVYIPRNEICEQVTSKRFGNTCVGPTTRSLGTSNSKPPMADTYDKHQILRCMASDSSTVFPVLSSSDGSRQQQH